MKTTESINDIAKAMSLAQQQMKPALKDSKNPHFKSKYADISSVWEAIREPITANGLTIWQDVTTDEKCICIITRIVHISGQWVEFGPLNIPLSKMDAHGVGSAVSYGKRYALCAAIGVVSADEDDDGNAIKAPPSSYPIKIGVSPDQIRELNEILDECDPLYVRKVMDALLKGNPSIDNFKNLTPDLYEKIKISALKQRDEFRNKIREVGSEQS